MDKSSAFRHALWLHYFEVVEPSLVLGYGCGTEEPTDRARAPWRRGVTRDIYAKRASLSSYCAMIWSNEVACECWEVVEMVNTSGETGE